MSLIDMANTKTGRLMIDSGLSRTDSGLTATSGLMANMKLNHVKGKINISAQELNPSPGKILLPSTIGIPPRNGSPESRLRDPRILWAPAISISGKNDQPLITPQYQKKEQRIAEKSELVKLNPKTATNSDLSHLTRIGNNKSKLLISFLPHKINSSKRPTSTIKTAPGPTSYQRYKGYDKMGEEYIYTRQPHVRIHPLIGSKLKREQRYIDKDLFDKKNIFKDMRPFWTTIGTRTYNSRLPNAPVSTIHHRFNMTLDMEEKKNKSRGMTMPGPAMYPVVDGKNGTTTRDQCSARGLTISPKYREKRLSLVGPGPAMVERELLDKGYKNILRTTPAFSMSSRWSPYSHTYTAECPDNFFSFL